MRRTVVATRRLTRTIGAWVAPPVGGTSATWHVQGGERNSESGGSVTMLRHPSRGQRTKMTSTRTYEDWAEMDAEREGEVEPST